MNLVGDQGTPASETNPSPPSATSWTEPPPAGVKAYVSGAAPLASDMQHSGNNSILKITVVTVVIIFTVLLIVYRSVATVIVLLVMVGVELAAARGVVAFLGPQ